MFGLSKQNLVKQTHSNRAVTSPDHAILCCAPCSSICGAGPTILQATAAIATSCVVLITPAYAAEPIQASAAARSWAACRPQTSCVSTNSFASPAQYLAPWSFQPDKQEVAFRRLLAHLESLHAVVLDLDAAAGFVLAQLPVGNSEYDTIRLKLQADGVVLFKSEASRNQPDPPFCFTPGCISGPGNRQRMNSLRDAMGWTVLETDEDKQWVQILLH